MNTILNYYKEFELTDISREITHLVIEGGDGLFGDLLVSEYEQLESFEVKKYCLQHIRSLVIENNPSLKSIHFDAFTCMYVVWLELSSLID